MQLLFETFFYIFYRFDDTRIKQKNRFFSKVCITSQTCKKAHKKKYGSLIFSYFTTFSKLIKIGEGHLRHFPC